MTAVGVARYHELREQFAVSRETAQQALAWAQPLAMEALGIHTRRQTLVEDQLPAYIVTTTARTNGGWGELMPVWFKPYERPVPLYCLDNWALFALLYGSAFGTGLNPAAFTPETLARVVIGADLLIPFLPGTDGVGRFLRHGALPVLLAVLWLEPETREAWLAMHAAGARAFALDQHWPRQDRLGGWLEQIENEAWLAAEREPVAGPEAVVAFLADQQRFLHYARLFGGLCLTIAALSSAWGAEWRAWVFQAVNVGYRQKGFGLAEVGAWLMRRTTPK